jgi:hypothetical protein
VYLRRIKAGHLGRGIQDLTLGFLETQEQEGKKI